MTTLQATFLVTGLVLLPVGGLAVFPAARGCAGHSGGPAGRGDRALAGVLAGLGAALVVLAVLLRG